LRIAIDVDSPYQEECRRERAPKRIKCTFSLCSFHLQNGSEVVAQRHYAYPWNDRVSRQQPKNSVLILDEILLVQQCPYPVKVSPTRRVVVIERVMEEHQRRADCDHQPAREENCAREEDHCRSQGTQGDEED